MQQMGIKDVKRVYSTRELAPAKNIVFAATGVTDGALTEGSALLWRRSSHGLAGHEPVRAKGAIRGHRPSGQPTGYQGAVLSCELLRNCARTMHDEGFDLLRS